MILLAVGPPILAGGYWLQRNLIVKPDSWEDVGGPGAIDSFGSSGCVLWLTSESEGAVEETNETNELSAP